MENCRCGVPSASQEVKTPGPNRGRWYWRCPTGTCRFFKWDDSALPFIRHPTEIYAAAAPIGGYKRRPMSLPFSYIRGKDMGLNRTTVKIAFSLISSELIGLRSQKNLTVDPLIARIKHIQWDESLEQWTIPATLRHYRDALEALPHDLPNIILEIDKIPDKVLEGIFKPVEYHHDPNQLSDSELRWLEFVESPVYQQLNGFQREGVRLGIERRGRILYGNENGIGIGEQALALVSVYRQEWPVLLTCPAVLCDTWYKLVQTFFGLHPSEICLLDDEAGVLFTRKSKKVNANKRRRKIRKVLSQPPTPTLSSDRSTSFRKSYKKRMEDGLKNGYFEQSDSEDDNEESDESDREGDEDTRRSRIKFYIASHLKVSKNKTRISEQHFKVVICDGSNYLKSKDQNLCQNICQLLGNYRRVILLSNKALHSLPVDLYPQINLIDKQWFPEMDTYVQRYCSPKSTVFGWTWNGRSNIYELTQLLNKRIWYCPTMAQMRLDTDDIVNQQIIFSAIRKIRHDPLPVVNPTAPVGSGATRQDLIDSYMEYTFDTFKRPKIAIVYYDTNVIKSIEVRLKNRKMRYVHINHMQDVTEKAEKYDESDAIQIILLNLDLPLLPIYLERVDLVIVVDTPTYEEKDDFLSYFKTHERTTPLVVQHLCLPNVRN